MNLTALVTTIVWVETIASSTNPQFVVNTVYKLLLYPMNKINNYPAMNFYVKIYHAKIPFYRHLRETRYNMYPLILCNYQVQLNTKRLYVKPLIVLRFLFDILRQQIWYIYCCTLFNSYWGQKEFIAYNIHILSEDIQFICTSVRIRKKTEPVVEKTNCQIV